MRYESSRLAGGRAMRGVIVDRWTRDELRALAEHSYARGVRDARRGRRTGPTGQVVLLSEWIKQRTQGLLSADTRSEEQS